MARIELKNGAGPSACHLQLSGFDFLPEGACRPRQLKFLLPAGDEVRIELKAIDWGRRESELWGIEGYATHMPAGYACPDLADDVLHVKFNPFRKKGGEVELELASECHNSMLVQSPGEGKVVWSRDCIACGKPVTRVSPVTGKEERLMGAPIDTDKDDLPPVGVVVERRVWVSYDPSTGGEVKIGVHRSEEDGPDSSNLLDIIPGTLKGSRPFVPSRDCGVYYVLHGWFDNMTPERRELVRRALGPELTGRLAVLQSAGIHCHKAPLALGEDIPAFNTVKPY